MRASTEATKSAAPTDNRPIVHVFVVVAIVIVVAIVVVVVEVSVGVFVLVGVVVLLEDESINCSDDVIGSLPATGL